MTCTEKWEDPWFQSLSGNTKLVAIYIWDRCDQGGFWQCNFASAEFHIKPETPIDWQKVYREMNTQPREELIGLDASAESDFKKVHRVDNYWWFPSYIPFQYGHGPLVDSTADKSGSLHAPMFRSLKKHGMMDEFRKLYPNIRIISPSAGPKPEDPAPPKDIAEVEAYARSQTPDIAPEKVKAFFHYHAATKWRVKGEVADWHHLWMRWATVAQLNEREANQAPKPNSSKIWAAQQQIEKLKAAIEEQKRNTFRPPGTFNDILTPAAKKAIKDMQDRIAELEKQIRELPPE